MNPFVEGLHYALQVDSVLWIGGGLLLGVLIGALPGMGITLGYALMLPVIIRLPAETGILVMVSMHIGSAFGNSIPAVVLRIPGTPSAMLTAVEGYPLYLAGQGGRALSVCLLANLVGHLLSVVVFIAAVIPLSRLAVKFLFPELAALILFGLLAASAVTGGNVVKGLAAIGLGFALAFIGIDPITGGERFTLGVPELFGGLNDVAVLLGFLALPELLDGIGRVETPVAAGPGRHVSMRLLTWEDVRLSLRPIAVESVVGIVVGILPGVGSTVAAFIAYQYAKLLARWPQRFGKGSMEALVALDASNTAAASGDLIPTFGLGIPGSAPMALLMAALFAQGIVPGPDILLTRPQLLYATFGGLLVAAVELAVVGYLAILPSLYVSRIPRSALNVAALALVLLGVYSARSSLFDVWVALAIGSVGYVMTRAGYPMAPAALAFLLGGMFESNLRRGLVMVGGWSQLLSRPITDVLLLLTLISLLVPRMLERMQERAQRRALESEELTG